ncbi:NADH-quinone oxidoreductase subunit NuoN [Betaproteobacteria bacterium PRO7]|jgi:NADH-quinone oxidoreductase subunit N|nr:NADH-quinone oxidoreductase subunit NuoN [Burkholderiaceae bacterium]MDL1860261.1 NADH-quinone oxidoreductase subunit NuoN [Betaproteobacteria bacterium PRO7]GIL04253.1 MAG: NADH-quinone oxidoreductase subunit N [Betaproteobacteria bacterium]
MDKLNLFAAAPEIALLAAAGVVMVADLFVSDARRNATYALTLAALVLVSGVCAFFLGNDVVQYAFHGMYVTDPMANVLKLFAALCTALMLVYAQGYARDRGIWKGEIFTLALFVLLGIFVMISANNLLVIYLGLELQALALYALVALRRDDARATEAAMKYFVLGALASGFLLYGMSMLYGAAGTLDLNDLARRIAGGQVASRPALVLGTVFIVAGLGFKFGAVPFHMWVPDVYHGAPTPVTVLIGSAPKIAAFAIAFRLLVEGLLPLAVDWQKMLVVLAVGSLAIGNVTAIAQSNLKRMLAYSTIGQMGFMLLAMLSGVVGGNTMSTANAYSAAMFYVITYAITTLGTFGIIMLLARQGFEAEEIADLRGLNRRSPWYAFVMLLLMFSLAGVPPTVGFYAKLVVLQALLGSGITTGMVWLAVIAVLFSLVGAFYYLRVVKVMYFDEPADNAPIVAAQDMRVALSANGAFVLVLGVIPQYLLALCANAMIRTLGG